MVDEKNKGENSTLERDGGKEQVWPGIYARTKSQ